jgi:restriction system protein
MSPCSDTRILANMWMVRAGRGGDSVEDFIKHGLVALGDTRLGKLDPSIKKEDLLKLFAAKYPRGEGRESRGLGEPIRTPD